MREEVKKNLKILMKNQAIFKYPLSFEEEEEKKEFQGFSNFAVFPSTW